MTTLFHNFSFSLWMNTCTFHRNANRIPFPEKDSHGFPCALWTNFALLPRLKYEIKLANSNGQKVNND